MANKKQRNHFSKLDVNEQILLLKSIMESSTEYSIIALDLKGNIIAWNAGAHKLYGYDSSDVIGKNTEILCNPDEIKSGKNQTVFDKVLQTGTWSGVLRRVRKDGNHFNAFVTATLRKDLNNNVIGYTVISRDLSDLENVLDLLNKLKASEALLKNRNIELAKRSIELQEADRLKSEFLASASHELRTPLNGIIGFTELIYDGAISPSSPKYKEFLGDILSSAKQLLTLINEILDLTKIEAGKFDFSPVKVNLVDLMNEIQDSFHSLFLKKHILFGIVIDPVLNEVIIDPEMLRRVINNYISNAIKFTAENGHITVRIYPVSKKNFRLEVQDTGIGIRSEDLNKLFTKFQQLESGSSQSYQGTGLGLSLVKHLVDAQGGQVGVESTVGKGSTFYAILPSFPYHRTFISHKTDLSAQPSSDEQNHEVLIIERDSIERQIMLDALMVAGYKVTASENISEAAKQEHIHQFDAIILDLFNPDIGDWKLLRTLHSNMSSQEVNPVVIAAAFEQPIRSKIQGFLIKPVETKSLLDALKKVTFKPQSTKTILIIDNDQQTILPTSKILVEYGFRVICKDNKISALLAVEQESPDVVILDPFMSGMDGYEFLLYYHQTERGAYTPIIIWTQTKLSEEARTRLKISIQRVILNGRNMNMPLPEGLV